MSAFAGHLHQALGGAAWPWIALILLGAFHGINPGMGWLFSVALGLQERNRAAVLRALPPIALGHAASIAVVAGVVGLAQAVIPSRALHWAVAALLIGFGIFKLVSTRHPRWVGMRVGFRDLTLWSFLMASAHGAGLMLVPVLLRLPHGSFLKAASAAPLHPAAMAAMPANCPMLANTPAPPPTAPSLLDLWPPVAAVGVHTLSHLLVAGTVAVVVYEKLGLSLLRQSWYNLDAVWAVALIAAGGAAAFL